MSLFDDLANALGHTVNSLAQAIGTDIGQAETFVTDLTSCGIDVVTQAANLHLDPATFLQQMYNLTQRDPHTLLTSILTHPFAPKQVPLEDVSQLWLQMSSLHQQTAQTINGHINDLYGDSGSTIFSGLSANNLYSLHTTYQDYYTNTLVDHAQTQHLRHRLLSDHVQTYVGGISPKVQALPVPLAALGVLTAYTALSDAPPTTSTDWIDQLEIWANQTANELEQDAENTPGGPDNPWADILLLLALALLLLAGLAWVLKTLYDDLIGHQTQQNNTKIKIPPQPPLPPTKPHNSITTALRSTAKKLANEFGVDENLVEQLLADGYTEDEIRALLSQWKKNCTDARKYQSCMNRQLQQLIDRYNNLTQVQYQTLRNLGYSDAEIRALLAANQVSPDQLAVNTEMSYQQAQILQQVGGFTQTDIHNMLLAGFTADDIKNLLARIQRAKKGQDSLTVEEIRTLVNAIVAAKLSGDQGQARAAQVAQCILDRVTGFQDPVYRSDGTLASDLDVSTAHVSIEAKIDSVTGDAVKQVQKQLDYNGGKSVILYAPGYGDTASKDIYALRGSSGNKAYVVHNCAELRALLDKIDR